MGLVLTLVGTLSCCVLTFARLSDPPFLFPQFKASVWGVINEQPVAEPSNASGALT
jgi:hypothetical protein